MGVDHESPIPVYVQIGRMIAARIEAVELQPDRPIPSEQSMIQEFGVARDTVRRAVAWLRDQGLVYTVPQRGSFVRPPD